MKNLLLILLLISFNGIAQINQIEDDVYQFEVKDVLITAYFYHLPYESDDYEIILEKYSKTYKDKTVIGLHKALSNYSTDILKLIAPEFYFVPYMNTKHTGNKVYGLCWDNKKIALEPSMLIYDITKTLHHELFHSIVYSKDDYIFNETSQHSVVVVNENYYAAGYATNYGRISSQEEDYAEIFGHLMTRSEIIEFVIQNPNSILADKVKRIIKFINTVDITIDFNFFKNTEKYLY